MTYLTTTPAPFGRPFTSLNLSSLRTKQKRVSTNGANTTQTNAPLARVRAVPTHLRRSIGGPAGAGATVPHAQPPRTTMQRGHGVLLLLLHRLMHVPGTTVVLVLLLLAVAGVPHRGTAVVVPAGVHMMSCVVSRHVRSKRVRVAVWCG